MIKPLIYALITAFFVMQTANVPMAGEKTHTVAHTVTAAAHN